jgi:elongator complex protein 3
MNVKNYNFEYKKYRTELLAILQEISNTEKLTEDKFVRILAKYPKDSNQIFSKNQLVLAYKALLLEAQPVIQDNPELLKKIQMKPVRTISGVTPVTILTKPFPCPGKCIFCPNDIRMPKSYLSDEPGAQRAERNSFDPYLQTFDRLKALKNIGHNTDKIEIIVLGGTWSYYPEAYQIWFIKRCFQAMNDFGEGLEQSFSELNNRLAKPNHRDELKNHEIVRNTRPLGSHGLTYNQMITRKIKDESDQNGINPETATWEELIFEQKRNETGNTRCVGLVIETRPDNISPEEVIRVRKLGCTKTQIGFQSLNDHVLELNHRGHDIQATRKAVELLRLAGFKVHAHWMANLYGSDVNGDIADFKKMFSDPDFRPDELKVYPCSLIDTAELMDYYEKGLWQPYSHEQLMEVITEVMKSTPEFCRLTRIIRDIPGTDIVTGNKVTNFRQIAELELDKRGIVRNDIRSREIKNLHVTEDDLELKILAYRSSIGTELFLQYVTKKNLIAGFLRLSLPGYFIPQNLDMQFLNDNQIKELFEKIDFTHPFISELTNSSIIREIHVYGRAANLGEKSEDKAQHLGLGTKLIAKAREISSGFEYGKMAVISSVGTREYYRKKGFTDGELYQFMGLV